MNTPRSMLSRLLLLAALIWPAWAFAQAAPNLPPATAYSEKGADTCLECHDDETAAYSASALFKGKHAHRGDARAPFGKGGLQCEACHGPGARHSAKGSNKKATINSLKADSDRPVAERNGQCLACHQNSARTVWHAGAHERGNLACTDCHKMHQDKDAVLAKATEAEVCYRCHKTQRAEFQKTSAHPVRQGRMACSDCHNAHGNANAAGLVKATLNQTCFSCHADKRGPLLWEHAPVVENCANCHTAHGSVRNALLTKSTPLLCQQCHTAAGHPSVGRNGQALPGNGSTGSIFVIAGSCTNCHSQVHGSNHPAGAKLMR